MTVRDLAPFYHVSLDIPMLLNRIIGASLVLVPAYSKRLDFVVEEARVLGARQQAVVAVPSRCWPGDA